MRCLGALALALGLAGCATSAPGPGASRADLAFPAPGTHWITRSANQAGQQWTTTWVVLDEGEWGGRPVYRVSDQVDVLVYDKATRNWMATLRWDDERFVADPHTGTFQWPLEVGRVWESRYAYHDHQRGRSFRNVRFTWQVEAREEVRTPAGRFQAFRLRGRNPFSETEIWYAPGLALIVKEVQERFVGHSLGPGRVTTELLRYAPPGGERWFGFSLEAVNAAVQRGQGREALAFHEREAADLERRGLPFEAAQAHVAAMWAARPLGLFQRSLKAGARAIELLRAERRTDDVLGRLANAYFTMGNVYRMAGDRAAARRLQEEGAALTAAFEQSRSRLFWSAVFARGLAQVALAEADYPTAIRQGGEAIQTLERFIGSLHTDSPFDQARRNGRTNLGWALTLVGNTHRRAGNAAAAEPLLQRALGLARELRNDELALDAILPLGWVAQGRGDHAAALARFEEGQAIATRLNHASYLMWLHTGAGWSLYRTGRHEAALAAFRGVARLEDLRSALEESSLRSGYVEDKQQIYHGAVWSAVELGRSDEAFAYAERARSRAFLDLLGTQTVLSKGRTRQLVEEETRLRARLGEAKARAEEGGDRAAARRLLEAAERDYRGFLDRVRRESAEQASLMTVEPVTLPEIQRLLPEGTTLVEYLVSDRASLAWVIDRDRAELVRLPSPRADLVGEVRAFRQGIEGQAPLPDAAARAERLYARLFAPLRPHVRTERVVIVPHEVLHYLPFGALRSPAGRWLVEDYTLSTLPSASVIRFLKDKATAMAGVVAVGNPDLGPALSLRYAEREARDIGQRFPGATVLVRQQATEARAKALSGAAGLIHFATHGELSEGDPLGSALLLVPGDSEDGRLEVREIFGMDLRAGLVVLSACETGLGKLSTGDELVGLQRAFLYAGTPAVVTTLWKVDDRASFVLMRTFYEQLGGGGPAAALRAAQRATMREFDHPFAWAAFGLTGLSR
ncbi:MAG: CHAT domain-containing protein [Candidatus Rokubacteria bacterium]|nr:CHAT domain-containing protein [Candidatus Rokubacteria bacterium]